MIRRGMLLTILMGALNVGLAMSPVALETNARQPLAQATSGQRFRLDPSQSKFIAHALRGGLLWFKGHEHLVAAREFGGEAQLNPASLAASSLQLTVKSASMEETSDAFTAQQKKIING